MFLIIVLVMIIFYSKILPRHIKYKMFLDKYPNLNCYSFLTKYYGIGVGAPHFNILALLDRVLGLNTRNKKIKTKDFTYKVKNFIFFILEHFFERKSDLWLKKKKTN